MLKIYLITYGTSEYRISKFFLLLTAKLFGCDHVVLKSRNDLIETEFYKKNRTILDVKRGGGLWLWKYYFIKELMGKINEGDVVIYCDSAVIFRRSITPLIKILINKTKGVLLFYNDHRNKNWTKMDCFVRLGVMNELWYESPQIGAQFQMFRKCAYSVDFVNEVLSYSCEPNLINDEPNILGHKNLPEFIENRHDQSITSLLAHKHKISLFPDPSQFRTKNVVYTFPEEEVISEKLYDSIIYVHRLKGMKTLALPFKLIFG